MAEPVERECVRGILGAELSDEEADALVATSSALSKAVAAMPRQELRQVDPPLRSIPGPRRP
ncbi:MAG TPA: hypothetical protein VFB50_23345 [Chloroflexota bacterium]|nr:hypothetical protein [Chloroflexota bacterium]